MYQIAYIGVRETLPKTAEVIYEHDIPKLREMLQDGLKSECSYSIKRIYKTYAIGDCCFSKRCTYDSLFVGAWS